MSKVNSKSVQRRIRSQVAYLCAECAKTLGATRMKGPCTQHVDTCEVCKEIAGLTHVGDWVWPDGFMKEYWD